MKTIKPSLENTLSAGCGDQFSREFQVSIISHITERVSSYIPQNVLLK